MSRITPSRRRRRSAFTIVELMVAMTVGGIAISSIYAIGSVATKNFREQQRVAATQSSLRAAMNQLKRDFQRAGFLGTPNAAQPGELCMLAAGDIDNGTGIAGTGRLAAISTLFKAVARPASFGTDVNRNAWATVDDVTLIGNFSTSGEYMGITMAIDGMSADVPVSSQSFQRDFTHWYAANGRPAGACNEEALRAAFRPGRLARVHALNDLAAYVPIADASCDAATPEAEIRFSQAVLRTACSADGGWVSPVNTIRYHVADAIDAAASRTGTNTVAVLRRTEVLPNDKTKPLLIDNDRNRPVDDRAVLEDVVRFNVDFVMTDNTGARSLSWVPAPAADVRANPQRVRGAIIELSARTADSDPDLASRPPFTFDVLGKTGAARVRTLRAELFLPNIALEGYF